MNIDSNKNADGTVKLTVTVSLDDMAPFLSKAVTRLAHKHQIPGFRPGKAPQKLIEDKFGKMAVLEEALQDIVTGTLFQALKEQSLESVGQPEISVEKAAPDNPIVYTAMVALMPTVDLGQWRSVRIEGKQVEVTDADIDKTIDDLRETQATEALVKRPAAQGDKVEVNFTVTRDGAVIEGGTGVKYPVIIGRGSMIPGFEEQLVGLAAGEKKEFALTFPKPYLEESLAGKEAQFSVDVIGVYERTLPAKDDAWAQRVIGKGYAELRSLVRENLTKEKKDQEAIRREGAAMDAVIKGGTFSVLPDVLLSSELKKMLFELKDDIQRRGMEWEKYLQSIKKSEDDLSKDFRPQAEKRVKAALALRSLTDELKTEVTDHELTEELQRHKEQYKDDKRAQEQLAKPEYREYLKRVLSNRKTIDKVVSLVVSSK